MAEERINAFKDRSVIKLSKLTCKKKKGEEKKRLSK
jgi:hypothetical protein